MLSMKMLLMKTSGVSIWLLAEEIAVVNRRIVPNLSHKYAKYEFILLWKKSIKNNVLQFLVRLELNKK